MSFPGRINEYRCDECHGVMVTIDVDEGDTPYFVNCQLRVNRWIDGTTRLMGDVCGGRSVSALYDCSQRQPARFEWVQATARDWYERWKSSKGILLLRQR